MRNTQNNFNKWGLVTVLMLFFCCYGCHNDDESALVIEQKDLQGAITFRIDSIGYPEVADFPVYLTVINRSKNIILMPFDSLSCPSIDGKNQILLTAASKKYLISVKSPYLLCYPLSSTKFHGFAEFIVGCGFSSYNEIKAAFSIGTLNYLGDINSLNRQNVNIADSVHTVIVPKRVDAMHIKPATYY